MNLLSEGRFLLFPLAKAGAGASPGAAAFLEDLIDACVMESYFREHMAERDLLFHATVAQILKETHTKPRSREQEAKESEVFSSPEFLRAFVSSCETSPSATASTASPPTTPTSSPSSNRRGKFRHSHQP